MDRIKYIFAEYDIIDRNPGEQFERYSSKSIPSGTLAYADNLLFCIRCQLVMGGHAYITKTFDEVMELFTTFEDLTGQYFALTSFGILCRDQGNILKGRQVLSKAHNISYQLNDLNLTVNSLINLASVNQSSKNAEQELDILSKAMQYVDDLDYHKIIGDLNNNYGYFLARVGRHREAMPYYEKALEHFDLHYHGENVTNILVVKENMAEVYSLIGEYGKAIELFEEVLTDAHEKKVRMIEMDSYRGLGELYERMGEYKKALESFRQHSELGEIVYIQRQTEAYNNVKTLLNMELEETREQIVFQNIELKKKTLELEKTVQSLSLIGKVGRKMTSTNNQEQLFELILESVYDGVSFDIVGLMLVDEEKQIIDYKYFEENRKRIYNITKVSFDNRNSMASYVARHRKDIIIGDIMKESGLYIDDFIHYEDEYKYGRFPQSLIFCQLVSEGSLIGMMTIQSHEPNKYSASDFQTIRSIASYVAISLSNSIKNQIIEQKAAQLEKLSYYDALTGLENRRAFTFFTEEIQAGKVPYRSIAMIVADLNHLKTINDNMGHHTGDEYLLEMSQILLQCAHNNRVFRLSGDEFAVVMVDRSREELADFIVMVKQACEKKNFQPYPLSLAIGYAYSKEIYDMNKMFIKAESRMYIDKSDYYKKNHYERRRR